MNEREYGILDRDGKFVPVERISASESVMWFRDESATRCACDDKGPCLYHGALAHTVGGGASVQESAPYLLNPVLLSILKNKLAEAQLREEEAITLPPLTIAEATAIHDSLASLRPAAAPSEEPSGWLIEWRNEDGSWDFVGYQPHLPTWIDNEVNRAVPLYRAAAALPPTRSTRERREPGCGICGGRQVEIRGRYPKAENRVVCPTCLADRLEQVRVIADRSYGVAYAATPPEREPQEGG